MSTTSERSGGDLNTVADFAFGSSNQDFKKNRPAGVLIQSPLPESKTGRDWSTKFLSLFLGSAIQTDDVTEAIHLLNEMFTEGLRVVVQSNVDVQIASTESSISRFVHLAFPDLSHDGLRIRPTGMPDPLNDGALTLLVWVFPS